MNYIKTDGKTVRDAKYELTEDEKASLRIIRLESEIIRTKEKLIELNQELDGLIEEMIP